ncbi:hypothetical protein QFC19_002776 [Naganishia cerealis]|uniref:Uncharacterized protein n=1 Tax=Naganishia cerealis TaxID=610337 RepID=A0ACC2W978_9TREE|nr:hypothetical protein QFC19_002776 [Naganishia cerealis]
MAPNGKKKETAPSFEDVEAKRLDMLKSLTAVAEAMEQATSSVRTYLQYAPNGLQEPVETAAQTKKRKADEKRKNKDPNMPKRPVTGYLAYSKDQMPLLRQAHPDMPHKALVGLVTEKWNQLGEEEKKPYNDTYAAAMEEWKEKTHEYKSTHDAGAAVAPAMAAASAVTAAAISAGKVINPDAETASEAGSDDEESPASGTSGSSSSSESEDEEVEEDEHADQAPPAKKAKKEAATATPSKSQQQQKPKSAGAAPASGKKAAATPSATETSKKAGKNGKKTEAAAPASSEETPAKKRGRKPKAQ